MLAKWRAEKRPDLDHDRFQLYLDLCDKFRDEKLVPKYGRGNLMQLTALYVLPNLWKRGLGTALARWGIDYARKNNRVIWAAASVTGAALYRTLGFVDEFNFELRWKDEEFFIQLPVLTWSAANEIAKADASD